MLDALLTRFAAYPLPWPRHLRWLTQAERWHRRRWLTDEQLAAVRAAYPLDCYRPAWPLRVGLFIITLIGFGLGGGFFAFFITTAIQEFSLTVYALVAAVGALFWLELGIREKRLYHAGPDNALLYVALGAAATLAARYSWVWNDFSLTSWRSVPLVLVWLGLALAATARYAERGAAGAAFAGALLVLVNLLLPLSWGRLALPLVGFGFGAAVAWLTREPRRATPAAYYYEGVRQTWRLLALATTYLSVNYLVVREVNAALSGQYVSAHPPLGGVCIVLTAVLPVVFIALGLRRPDRVLLLVGLAALAFSFYTLRHYRPLLPLSVAATLVGAAALAVALFGLRYLRPERHTLTSHPDAADLDDEDAAANPFGRAALESLVSVRLSAGLAAPDTGPRTEFGGGQFGGGGASSGF